MRCFVQLLQDLIIAQDDASRGISDPEGEDAAAAGSEHSSSFGYLLRRLLGVYRKNFLRIAKDDLPNGQVGVLILIGQNPGITPSQISAKLGSEPAQVAVLINKLELQRLIRRVRSKGDGRVRPLRLTAKGERYFAQTTLIAAEAEATFIGEALSEAEADQLRSLLRKLLIYHV